jgi:hypothetical protein
LHGAILSFRSVKLTTMNYSRPVKARQNHGEPGSRRPDQRSTKKFAALNEFHPNKAAA